jgi:hypothetical protein
MENVSPVAKLIERVEGYGNTTIELVKLTAIDKTSEVVSSLAARLTVFVIIILSAFVANIGLSLWIGELLGKTYYGFFAVTGLYALIAIIVYACKDIWIKNPVKNSLINQMLKTKTV